MHKSENPGNTPFVGILEVEKGRFYDKFTTNEIKNRSEELCKRNTSSLWRGIFKCVPSMALILLVKVQSRVFTAKCSEPQADASNDMGEGSGVAKFLSLRTETWSGD